MALANLITGAAALALCASIQAQTTVTLPADKDTTLYEPQGGLRANGSGPSIFCGRVGPNGGGRKRRALLHFDVAGNLPAGARVLSVEFDIFSAQSTAFLPIQTFVHRVTQDWSEGSVVNLPGGQGGSPTSGETTWQHTNYPNANWNNPGGDFDATPSFTFDLASLGPSNVPVNPGLVADVQSWVDNPSGNFGWLLKTDEVFMQTARRLYSREFGQSPPRITVTYLAPGQVGNYGTGWPVNGAPFQLDASGSATGPNPFQVPVTFSNAPGPLSVGALFLSFELDPVGTLLPGGGPLYLPISGPLIDGGVFTVASGFGATLLNLPGGFPGFLVTMQAAVIDSSPLGFTLSNAGALLTQ
jgi:hypothetical protein